MLTVSVAPSLIPVWQVLLRSQSVVNNQPLLTFSCPVGLWVVVWLWTCPPCPWVKLFMFPTCEGGTELSRIQKWVQFYSSTLCSHKKQKSAFSFNSNPFFFISDKDLSANPTELTALCVVQCILFFSIVDNSWAQWTIEEFLFGFNHTQNHLDLDLKSFFFFFFLAINLVMGTRHFHMTWKEVWLPLIDWLIIFSRR